MKKILAIFLVIILATGCTENIEDECNGIACALPVATQYKTIEAIDVKDTYKIIDVRSVEDFKSGHIKGSVNIDDIEDVEYEFDEVIVVYCNSGATSEEFSKKLIDAGYKYVYDLGSIDNWNGELVKSLY